MFASIGNSELKAKPIKKSINRKNKTNNKNGSLLTPKKSGKQPANGGALVRQTVRDKLDDLLAFNELGAGSSSDSGGGGGARQGWRADGRGDYVRTAVGYDSR